MGELQEGLDDLRAGFRLLIARDQLDDDQVIAIAEEEAAGFADRAGAIGHEGDHPLYGGALLLVNALATAGHLVAQALQQVVRAANDEGLAADVGPIITKIWQHVQDGAVLLDLDDELNEGGS